MSETDVVVIHESIVDGSVVRLLCAGDYREKLQAFVDSLARPQTAAQPEPVQQQAAPIHARA